MNFLKTILQKKQEEVEKLSKEPVSPLREVTSFYQRVKEEPSKMHIIGEIKRASPSKGAINQEVDIIKQAKLYEEAGVSAISVLTDASFFNGGIEDLKQVASAVYLPVLCKDFIIDEKQLIQARNAGATIILLIVAALPSEKLRKLFQKATELELEVLVEVHNAQELKQAEKLPAKLIGVNNRNLATFDVSIETSKNLGVQRGSEAIYISESGFETAEQVKQVASCYQGVLVGETLMRAKNPKEKVQELRVIR